MGQGSSPTTDRLSIAFALGAAALFGLSAPAGKALVAVTDPWLLAGLLYLGSGLALGAYRVARGLRSRPAARDATLGRRDWPWLGAAILAGGVIAPVLLMFGLSRVSAAEASLLLNLEGVFTAVVAWVVFREHAGTGTEALARLGQREVGSTGCITLLTTYSPMRSPISVPTRVEKR